MTIFHTERRAVWGGALATVVAVVVPPGTSFILISALCFVGKPWDNYSGSSYTIYINKKLSGIGKHRQIGLAVLLESVSIAYHFLPHRRDKNDGTAVRYCTAVRLSRITSDSSFTSMLSYSRDSNKQHHDIMFGSWTTPWGGRFSPSPWPIMPCPPRQRRRWPSRRRCRVSRGMSRRWTSACRRWDRSRGNLVSSWCHSKSEGGTREGGKDCPPKKQTNSKSVRWILIFLWLQCVGWQDTMVLALSLPKSSGWDLGESSPKHSDIREFGNHDLRQVKYCGISPHSEKWRLQVYKEASAIIKEVKGYDSQHSRLCDLTENSTNLFMPTGE